MSDLNDFKNKNTKFTGTTGERVSPGTTLERVDETGRIRFNTTTNFMEYYNGTGWITIDAPPTISSVTPSNIDEADTTSTFSILGSNFSANATALLINDNGVEIAFTTVTRVSATEITAVLTNSNLGAVSEPYDIKVTNASGLAAVLADSINVNESPTWSTAAGSLGTLTDSSRGAGNLSTSTLVATDPEGGDVDYFISSGALPSGLSLNSETGAITGTAAAETSNTTYNFTVQAYDTASNFTARSFSITVNAPQIETFTSSGTFSVPAGVTAVDVLVVAGGGGGGGPLNPGFNGGGGGGAGGLIFRPGFTVTPEGSVSVTIGQGGNRTVPSAKATNGQNSVFGTLTAIGGGGGGGNDSAGPTPTISLDGSAGGSGGGAKGNSGNVGGAGNQPSQPGDSGTYGFGNAGGDIPGSGGGRGSGGGGAGAAGQPSGQPQAGAGGIGRQYDISGSNTYYAGGGGGGVSPPYPGQQASGGQGGGGNGGNTSPLVNGQPGTANTGGGGGGGQSPDPGSGAGLGGSGIVIVKY